MTDMKTIRDLPANIKGLVLEPHHRDYDEARRVSRGNR